MSSFLNKVTNEHFLKNFWGKKPLFLESGAADICGVFSWEKFNDLLTLQRLEPPRIRIMNEGESVPESSFTMRRKSLVNHSDTKHLDVSAINQLVSGGASLIVNAVDESVAELRELCFSLSKELFCNVSANAYVGFGDKPGFNAHWDDHEVIVTQISGRKYWKVYEEGRKNPLQNDIAANYRYTKKSFMGGRAKRR